MAAKSISGPWTQVRSFAARSPANRPLHPPYVQQYEPPRPVMCIAGAAPALQLRGPMLWETSTL